MLDAQVRRTIGQYHLFHEGDRVIVGVSGGLDSMVLLHLLHSFIPTFHLTLIVAHVNHRLRAEESEKEAEFVQSAASRLGLPFEYGEFDVREFQKRAGLSLEDAARRVRFKFFEKLLEKHQAQKIALAHHADDQVETTLLRLLRGAGVKGLKGMLPIHEGKVVRPLLEVWREDIESFAKEREIPYLIDSSNIQRDYLRNRIRLDLIPWIEKEYQPHFKKVLLRISKVLQIEDDFLEKEAEKAFQRLVREEEGGVAFFFSDFQALHPALQWRLIERLLKVSQFDEGREKRGVHQHRIFESLSYPSPSFTIQLSEGFFLEKKYNLVFLKKGKVERTPPFEVELHVPGRTYIKEIQREIQVDISERKFFKEIETSSSVALLDFQTVQFPLRVRNFRPGDRFQPLGLKGTQKVKEYFINHKIPRTERSKIPLLISGDRIAWIVGHRIDERFKITPETQKVLRVQFI